MLSLDHGAFREVPGQWSIGPVPGASLDGMGIAGGSDGIIDTPEIFDNRDADQLRKRTPYPPFRRIYVHLLEV